MVVLPLLLVISFHALLLYPLILYEHQINLPTLLRFLNLDNKVESIVEKSIDYQDSEILEEWEDLFDVHTVLEDTKNEYEDKLAKAQAKQPKAEW